MSSLLADLGRHQSWADAEYWRALEQCPRANEDEAIRKRLHHLHQVQRAFLWLARGNAPSTFTITTPQDFDSIAALRAFAKESSVSFADFVDAVSEERLSARIQLPWFAKDPPFSVTVAEALTQAMMHSQWHRGQNATRLRELNGEPPMVDLIVWYWKDRPAAIW